MTGFRYVEQVKFVVKQFPLKVFSFSLKWLVYGTFGKYLVFNILLENYHEANTCIHKQMYRYKEKHPDWVM